jgi:hypothetical protein
MNDMLIFQCDKCSWSFVAAPHMVRPAMTCGAVVGCHVNENGDAVPIGCGGNIKEVKNES